MCRANSGILRLRASSYAARHVGKGVGQALLAVIGIAFLLSFLPELPLPSIDLPDLPVPGIELPGWVKAVLETKQFRLPILHQLRRLPGTA